MYHVAFINSELNCMSELILYTTKNIFRKSFCVITHPIGQNGRAVCKKYGDHGDARGAKRRALGAAGRLAIDTRS